MTEDFWQVVERRVDPDDWKARGALQRKLVELRAKAGSLGQARGSWEAAEAGYFAAEALDEMVGRWMERIDIEIARGTRSWSESMATALGQRLRQRAIRWSEAIAGDLEARFGERVDRRALWDSRDRNIRIVEAELRARVSAQDARRHPLIERLSGVPRYERVYMAWGDVHEHLDHPGEAARIAVAGVEEMARIVLDRDSGTLGDLLKELQGEGFIDGRVKKAADVLWGWASNEVRHGRKLEGEVDSTEADWIVRHAEALIHLLLERDARR